MYVFSEDQLNKGEISEILSEILSHRFVGIYRSLMFSVVSCIRYEDLPLYINTEVYSPEHKYTPDPEWNHLIKRRLGDG